MVVRAWMMVLLLGGLCAGCDRHGGGAPTTQESGSLSIDVTLITPLLPRLGTRYALDGRGNLYWIQESEHPEPGGDLLFVMGESGVPQAVPELSAARLLALCGHPRGTGSIRSIAAGPNDELYVFFAGGDAKAPIAFLARYALGRHALAMAADTEQVMRDSGLGASIDLAQGSLVSNGSDLWLWMRSSLVGNASTLVKVTPRASGAGTDLRQLRPQVQVNETRRTPLVMDSEREDLAPGPAGSAYYLDRRRACLWKIDPSGGATRLQSIEGLSGGVTTPAVDENGRITLIAGDSEQLFSREGASTPMDWSRLRYPAMVRIEGEKVKTIGAADIHGPPNLPLQNLQARGLLYDRSHGTWVTFDAASGELLGLKIVRR
jgi:hypothetical protein